MIRLEHPISSEELMAFVDGELQDREMSKVTEHLETCSECAAVIADARQVSGQLASWEVEEPTKRVQNQVFAELRATTGERPVPVRGRWTIQRTFAYGLGAAVAVVLVLSLSIPSLLRSRQAAVEQGTNYGMLRNPEPASMPAPFGESPRGLQGLQAQQGQQGSPVPSGQQSAVVVPSSPMVIRTVKWTLITKEFDAARLGIDTTVKQLQGYVDQLTVRGDVGVARHLSAILRVPATQVDLGSAELKKLGRLIDESQSSADITSQYVDLAARLSNARNSEQRLLRLLGERAGNLAEVVQMEREIASVRENIERMEAQQKDLGNKVQFATIHLELAEEYRAQLIVPTPSTGAQLRNAFVDGIRSAGENALDIALFLFRFGPVLLIWLAVLGPVAFLLWRLRHRISI